MRDAVIGRLLPPLALALVIATAACRQQPDSPVATPSPTALVSVTPSPTPASAVDLSRYVGKYPTEKLSGGTSFLHHPAVRDAVASVVGDAAVRTRVLDADVTATPIVRYEGRLLAFGCEPHNCGPHNWAVAITPDARVASVCYYDQDARVARWYPEGAMPAPSGGCPSGD